MNEPLTQLHAEAMTAEREWTVEEIPVLSASISLPEPVPAADKVSRRIRRYYQLQCRSFLRYCETYLLPAAAENMAQVAFSTVFGSFGNFYVAICLLFFAFSTIIGWYFFGEQNVKYLFGVKAVKVYACIAVVCVALGAVLEAPLVWNLSDLFNALMVFPNLLALLALSGLVAKAARGGDALRK